MYMYPSRLCLVKRDPETSADAQKLAAFLGNMSKWNWGVTDPDFCCDDGKAPAYMLHTVRSAL